MAGSDVFGQSSVPQDIDGHGTEVTSLITAQGNNGKGIVGLAYRNVNLLPIRLYQHSGNELPYYTLSSGTNFGLYADNVFSAIKLAVNAGADVVNMSFFLTPDIVEIHSTDIDVNTQDCDVLIGFAI